MGQESGGRLRLDDERNECHLGVQPTNRPYLAIAASTRKTHPTPPKNKLTIQNRGFFVSAEIAAMAIAIWNIVTPRANTSCLWKFDLAAASLCSASDLISDSSS